MSSLGSYFSAYSLFTQYSSVLVFRREGELPFLIAHLSLHSEDGARSLDQGSQIGRENQAPILYGNLVSSVEHLEDLQGNMGLFFLFPDVSVRWTGRYQLGVTLSRISK